MGLLKSLLKKRSEIDPVGRFSETVHVRAQHKLLIDMSVSFSTYYI